MAEIISYNKDLSVEAKFKFPKNKVNYRLFTKPKLANLHNINTVKVSKAEFFNVNIASIEYDKDNCIYIIIPDAAFEVE